VVPGVARFVTVALCSTSGVADCGIRVLVGGSGVELGRTVTVGDGIEVLVAVLVGVLVLMVVGVGVGVAGSSTFGEPHAIRNNTDVSRTNPFPILELMVSSFQAPAWILDPEVL
jgi:hypothetical protein